MRITSGYIYYFIWCMIILTIMLGLLYFKGIRNFCFNLFRKIKIKDFPIYNMFFWITFCIIAVVMLDSIGTYYLTKQSIGSNYILIKDISGFKLDSFQAIKSDEKEDYLTIYKKLREYYMAERNFMLTASALIVMYIFSRFLKQF